MKKLLTIFWSVAAVLGRTMTAKAVDVNGTDFPGVDLTIQSIAAIITGLACWFSRIALVLIVIALVFYGLQFLWSRGNPDKYKSAKDAFWKGIIGVLIILGTYTIIATIANALGADYTLFIPLSCPAY